MLILFSFWLTNFCFGADPMPLLETSCENENQIFNTSEYRCTSCPENFIPIQNVCRPQNETFVVANSKPIEYVYECDENSIAIGLVCFPNDIFESRKNRIQELFNATYYDVIRDIDSETYDQISPQINPEFIEQYTWAELFYNADHFNQTAVSFLANSCAVFQYDSNTYSCIKFNQNFTQGGGNQYGYLFWPMNGPFITYGTNIPYRFIQEEDYIMNEFKLGDPVTFQLGRFSKYGQFLGFKQLSIDFQKCGSMNDHNDYWSKFGYNYYGTCFVDMNEFILTDSTDFYDPFIEDGTSDGKTILRPVPVVIKNYRGESGSESNRAKNDENYRAVRRFFLNDNYTSDEVVQHIVNFTITYSVISEDSHRIYPPIITIEYAQMRRNQLQNHDFVVSIDEETISSPKYTFEVRYKKGLGTFWQAVLIVFCLLLASSCLYFFISTIRFCRVYGADGAKWPVVLGIIGNFFSMMGTILFFICFVFSLYVFIFFKFQKSLILCLPDQKEFNDKLIPVLLATLVLKLLGVIFLTIMKSSTNMFIIDWETPKKADIPISGWRRIVVGNEWNRVLTVRHYNVAFTVLAMAFIIGGFNLEFLSTPIPSTKLADMGIQYIILRFAFTSSVWLLLILFQLLMTNLVIWPIFGNPFYNFVDLCTTSNCSVLIRTCSYQGYYLHGRNPAGVSDKDADQLHDNLIAEGFGQMPTRGLINGTSEQVFEVYLAIELRKILNDLYDAQLAQTGTPSVMNFKNHIAADIPRAAYEANKELNDFLKDFFNDNSDFNYVVDKKTFWQQFFKIVPTAFKESVFLIVSDSSYNDSLLCGIELELQLLYLLIFACVGILVSSPCIPALAVFVIDVIIVKIYNLIGRSNLSKKTLLDDRFFL